MKCSNPDCNRGVGLVAYRRAAGSASGLLFKALAQCVRGWCTKATTQAKRADLLRMAFFASD